MSTSGKERCCIQVPYGQWGKSNQCRNGASVTVEGKHYCGKHDPAKVRARKDARTAKFDADRDAFVLRHNAALSYSKHFTDPLAAAKGDALGDALEVIRMFLKYGSHACGVQEDARALLTTVKEGRNEAWA